MENENILNEEVQQQLFAVLSIALTFAFLQRYFDFKDRERLLEAHRETEDD